MSAVKLIKIIDAVCGEVKELATLRVFLMHLVLSYAVTHQDEVEKVLKKIEQILRE